MKSFLIFACVFGLCCAVLAEDEDHREKRSSSRSSERYRPGGFFKPYPFQRPYPYPYQPPNTNALLNLLPFILAQLGSTTPAPAPAPAPAPVPTPAPAPAPGGR